MMHSSGLPLLLLLLLSLTRVVTGANQEPAEATIMTLDVDGTRGVVFFDHSLHESTAPGSMAHEGRLDPNAAPSSTCSSCHHARRSDGVPELAACSSCHQSQGHPGNPLDASGTSIGRRLAFHGACIQCHRESQGPTLCGGCHKGSGSG